MRTFAALRLFLSVLMVALSTLSFGQLLFHHGKTIDYNNTVDTAGKCILDPQGNLYIATETTHNNDSQYVVTKYDINGVRLWQNAFQFQTGNESVQDIALHPSGGVIILGDYFAGFGQGHNIHLWRVNASGALVWSQSVDLFGNRNDSAIGMALDGAGFVYVASRITNSNLSEFRFSISKYNMTGTQQWNWLTAPVTSDYAVSDIATNGSVAVMVGQKGPAGNWDAWAYAVRSDNALKWEKTIAAGQFNDYAQTVNAHQPSGDFLVGLNEGGDMGLQRVDWETGNTEWAYKYDNGSSDILRASTADAEGNSYISGSSYDPSTNVGFATVMVDSLGAEVWVRRFDDPGQNKLDVSWVGVDGSGSVLVAGGSEENDGTGNRRFKFQNISPSGVSTTYTSDPSASPEIVNHAALNDAGAFVMIGEGKDLNNDYDVYVQRWRQKPVPANDAYEGDEDINTGTAAPGLLANDLYTSGVTIQKLTEPTKGQAIVQQNGALTYIPQTDTTGTDSFTYRLVWNGNQSVTATVTLTIKPAPTSVDDSYSIPEDTALNVAAPGVLSNDQNVGNGIAKLWTNPTNGQVTLNDDGSFSYTPTQGFKGADTFTYKAERNQSLSNNTATVTIFVGEVTPQSLALNPTTVVGGNNTTATVTLVAAAPTGGVQLNVADNSSAVVTPPSFTVPAGQVSGSFTVGTTAVGAQATRQVSVNRAGVTKTANLIIVPAALASIAVNPNTVVGGQNTTATVALNGAAPGTGASVAITDNSSAINTPTNVVVPAGQFSVNFAVGTTYVAVDSPRSITATYNGVAKTTNLLIKTGYAVLGLQMNPSTVVGGNNSTGTVTLNKAAPAGGLVIDLSDNTSAINTPATVTIPAGSTTGQFVVTTSKVSQSYVRKVTASHNNTSKTADLVLTP